MELYRKYRPKVLDGVVGQETAIEKLKAALKEGLPHFILLSGPSGVGKTTIARILADRLGCSELDVYEINCADFTGVDTVREIRSRLDYAPLGGLARLYVIDEAHQLSTAAQNAFLKILEDTPKRVYFVFCTTNPEGLLRTIRTRAYEFELGAVPPQDLERLIRRVARKEGIQLDDGVVDRIVNEADGSARQALVFLDQIRGIDDPECQLEAIAKSAPQTTAAQIFYLLMKRRQWVEVAEVLKQYDDDPERLRRYLLAAGKQVLLSGGRGADAAFLIIEGLREPTWNVGMPGLVAALYAVVTAKGD